MINLQDITRLEVIDETGRVFGRWEIDGVSISGQDAGRTLKIFLDYGGESANRTTTILAAAANWLDQDEPNVEMALSAIRDHLDEILGGER